MNWDLFFTVLGLGLLGLILIPMYMVMFVAFHKSKFEATIESMVKMRKKFDDEDFDKGIETILFERGEHL